MASTSRPSGNGKLSLKRAGAGDRNIQVGGQDDAVVAEESTCLLTARTSGATAATRSVTVPPSWPSGRPAAAEPGAVHPCWWNEAGVEVLEIDGGKPAHVFRLGIASERQADHSDFSLGAIDPHRIEGEIDGEVRRAELGFHIELEGGGLDRSDLDAKLAGGRIEAPGAHGTICSTSPTVKPFGMSSSSAETCPCTGRIVRRQNPLTTPGPGTNRLDASAKKRVFSAGGIAGACAEGDHRRFGGLQHEGRSAGRLRQIRQRLYARRRAR